MTKNDKFRIHVCLGCLHSIRMKREGEERMRRVHQYRYAPIQNYGNPYLYQSHPYVNNTQFVDVPYTPNMYNQHITTGGYMPQQNMYEQGQPHYYPKQWMQTKSQPPQILAQFKNSDGTYNMDKMMNTAGQMMNAVNQLSTVFKGVTSIFKV
ncbi:YppG family protein [Priestia filamentosa]|nr:YppG family protein [Priestia filamentosa]